MTGRCNCFIARFIMSMFHSRSEFEGGRRPRREPGLEKSLAGRKWKESISYGHVHDDSFAISRVRAFPIHRVLLVPCVIVLRWSLQVRNFVTTYLLRSADVLAAGVKADLNEMMRSWSVGLDPCALPSKNPLNPKAPVVGPRFSAVRYDKSAGESAEEGTEAETEGAATQDGAGAVAGDRSEGGGDDASEATEDADETEDATKGDVAGGKDKNGDDESVRTQ